MTVDWVLLSAAVTAFAAVITALVTAMYTYFTLRLVRAQSDPKVIVYVKHDFDRPSILMIVVENIGRDIAQDVKFFPSHPIPAHAWGIELADAHQAAAHMSEGPLVAGIPALGPNDSRIITWGQYGGLSKALGGKPLHLRYTYTYQGREYEGETQLEVESYVGTNAAERPELAMSRSLKAIENGIGGISASISSIGAKVPDKAVAPRRRTWKKPTR